MEVINPARSLSHHPLFQVMLAFQNDAQVSLELPGLRTAFAEVPVASAKFDLSFALAEERAADGTPSGINGVLEYAGDLFEEATAATLAERLVRLLDRGRGGAHPRHRQLSTFSRRPSAAPSSQSGTTPRAPIPNATIPELFAQQAARTPDAVALVCEDQTLSYRTLDERANQLAHHLRSLGVGPETIVGLCVERSFDMVIALLGILKAGAAYLPLDPDYPKDRLAFMLADAGARLLVTQSALRDTAARPHTPASSTSTPTAPQSRASPPPPHTGRIDPRTTAYVIYTSGSSGQPKGVAVTHGGLANHMLWMREQYPTDQSDIVLSRTAISFDAAEWEIWLPLATGAALSIAPTAVTRDPGQLARYIERQSITIAQFVPSLLEPMLAAVPSDALHRLKRVFAGGEALSGSLARDAVTTLQRTAGQSLRADRDHDPDHVVAGHRRRRSARTTAAVHSDRSTDLEHAGLCPG